jgi:hypothetical protein
VVARQSAPVSGALCSGGVGGTPADGDSGYLEPGHWEVSAGYRWQHSSRPYIGTVEQVEFARQGLVSPNNIHLFNVGITYGVTRRFSVSVGIPFMIASRTRPAAWDRLGGIPNPTDQVYKSVGFGDVDIYGRLWLVRPPAEKHQNILIGFGVKLPTGKTDVSDDVNTPTGRRRLIVDQSIQLGDGGFGLTLDALAFKSFKRFTVFGLGTYLFNPRNTNGVHSGRPRLSEAVFSVSDQYLARAGVVVPVRKIRGFSISIGGRLEGVPRSDIFGKSDGFRRPGYAFSVEPGFIYRRKKRDLGCKCADRHIASATLERT